MTKPIETLRRGNGGRRLNKVEKDDITAALPTRGEFTAPGPCGWAEGCVWRGPLIEGLCAEHRSEKLRLARVSRWQEGRARTAPAPPGCVDHTAPWHCRLTGCAKCDGKPRYEEWVRGRAN